MEQTTDYLTQHDAQSAPSPSERRLAFSRVNPAAAPVAERRSIPSFPSYIRWAANTAAPASSSRISDLLLSAGGDLRAPITPDGKTMLHWAAMHNKVEMVCILLEQGVAVDTPTLNGATPLHLAAERGHAVVIELLIEHGADLRAFTVDGHTPLYYAARAHAETAVRCLLDHGVDINAPEANGLAPLHHAANDGLWSVIEILLEQGADVNARTVEGQTPLWFAVRGGYAPMVDLLLMHGADAEILPDAQSASGHAAHGWLPTRLAQWLSPDTVLSTMNHDYSRYVAASMLIIWMLLLLRGCRL